MKKITLFLVCLFIFPSLTNAEVTYTSWNPADGAYETRTERTDRIRQYRRESSEAQQRMSTLAPVANYEVYIPVLFGITRKSFSPNFGDPRSGGRLHEGEDILAPKGTPIVSPTAAVVMRVGTGPSEGNYVYTANPGGETFVYMHLDRIGEGVTEGALLSQGSLIGYVGDTGNATSGPAHLHFEIHASSSEPMDPYPRLTLEFSLQEKMTYLSNIFTKVSDGDVLAQFLVQNFKSTFTAAKNASISLPDRINSALGTISSVPVVVTPTTSSVAGCPAGYVCRAALATSSSTFTRALKQGMTGEDVRTLQKLLNGKGFTVALAGPGSIGSETTYFGPATTAAVIKFQLSKNITPSVGYFGPVTQAAI